MIKVQMCIGLERLGSMIDFMGLMKMSDKKVEYRERITIIIKNELLKPHFYSNRHRQSTYVHTHTHTLHWCTPIQSSPIALHRKPKEGTRTRTKNLSRPRKVSIAG